MAEHDKYADQLNRQEIDVILGSFNKVPCLDRPDKYICTRDCPHYYDAAGAVAVISRRDGISPEKVAKKTINKFNNLNPIGRANYRLALEKRGINLESCLHRKKA